MMMLTSVSVKQIKQLISRRIMLNRARERHGNGKTRPALVREPIKLLAGS